MRSQRWRYIRTCHVLSREHDFVILEYVYENAYKF